MAEGASYTGLILFWLGSMICIPLGIGLCRIWKNCMYVIFAMLILSTFMIDYSITFLSKETYRAATRGFEVHILDLLAVILLISMYLRPLEYRIRYRLPLLLPYALLLIVSLISWTTIEYATFPNFERFEHLGNLSVFDLYLYPLFEMSKMIRGIFLFFVVTNFLQDKKSLKVLIYSICTLLIFVTFWSLIYRYGYGEHRVGTGGQHANDLNSYIGIIGMLVFPLAFTAKNIRQSSLFWLVTGAGLVTIILTISRSSLAAYILGGFIIVSVSLVRTLSVRNLVMVGLSIFVCLGIAAKSFDSLADRFFKEQSTTWDVDNRAKLSLAAYLMGKDHLFGVGLGNYHFWSLNRYAQLAHSEPQTMAHNIWYLTYGELGLPGIIAFVILWLRYYQIIFSNLIKTWRSKDRYIFPLMLGVLCSTEVLQFQNIYHFSYRNTSVFFMIHIIMAFTVRVYLELKNAKHFEPISYTAPRSPSAQYGYQR